jgi:hypothetical protein
VEDMGDACGYVRDGILSKERVHYYESVGPWLCTKEEIKD